MPRGNGTGPAGYGPMTGRALGYCTGYSIPGYMNSVPGGNFFRRGTGYFGRGRQRGFRRMYRALAITPEQEKDALKNQAKIMQDSLHVLQQRIQELEKSEPEKEQPEV